MKYALFKPNDGVVDQATGLHYMNMFDAQMDAVFSAMKKVGYDDVEIVVGETGWPSVGDPNQLGVSKENAQSFNANLVKHVNSDKGTPLMPNRTFEVYVFVLFSDNMKDNVSEQNYGLWIGILVSSGFSVIPVPSYTWKAKFELSRSRTSKDDSRRVASTLFPSMSSLLKKKRSWKD